jgi:hypothetical protein
MPLYKRVFPRWGDCYRAHVGGDATAGWDDMPPPDVEGGGGGGEGDGDEL